MDSPYARRFEGLPFLYVIAKVPISSKSDSECWLGQGGGWLHFLSPSRGWENLLFQLDVFESFILNKGE